jgi:hypothetical protein
MFHHSSPSLLRPETHKYANELSPSRTGTLTYTVVSYTPVWAVPHAAAANTRMASLEPVPPVSFHCQCPRRRSAGWPACEGCLCAPQRGTRSHCSPHNTAAEGTDRFWQPGRPCYKLQWLRMGRQRERPGAAGAVCASRLPGESGPRALRCS